jgi:hypothetical protein
VLFKYRDLGQHELKGLARPVHLRQGTGASRVENRFRRPNFYLVVASNLLREQRLAR